MSHIQDEFLSQDEQLRSDSKTSTDVAEILDNLNKFVVTNGGKIDNKYTMYQFEQQFSDSTDMIREKICDIFGESLSQIDESDIIKHFKKIYSDKDIILRTNRLYTRNLITLNGEITYERYVLRPATENDKKKLLSLENIKTVIPLDEWLCIANLPFKITPNAMIEIAWYAAYQLSYFSAAEIIQKSLNIILSQETIRLVTDYIGKIVYNNDLNMANNIFEELNSGKLKFSPTKEEYVLYLMVDGSMIHTREKDEDGHKWRENKLGLIFSSDNMELKSKNTDKFNYNILKKEYVDYFGSVDLFQKLFFYGAIRNGYGKYYKTVLISDGASWIANMKETLFPDAIHILDFWHLSQHVYDFAKVFFNKNESKYKPWVESIKEKLVRSEYKYVIEEIMKMENQLKSKSNKLLNEDEKSKIGNLSKYILSHEKNIDYLSYRAQNLYIGSGHIESGNKSVAQERLKRPGMMWKVEKAQNLLMLRAKLKSNLWASDVKDIVLRYFNQV